MQLGDLATWCAALFTGGALFTALFQIRTERHIRAKNEADVLEDRNRAQASHVSAWIKETWAHDHQMWHAVQNTSHEPVYQVIITLVSIQGAGIPREGADIKGSWLPYHFRSYLSVLPPGKFYVSMPTGAQSMLVRFGVEVAFTDARGHFWVRKGDGYLEQLQSNPVEYYGLDSIVDWRYPEIESLDNVLGPDRHRMSDSNIIEPDPIGKSSARDDIE